MNNEDTNQLWRCFREDCSYATSTMEARNFHVKEKHPKDWEAVIKSLDERGIKHE